MSDREDVSDINQVSAEKSAEAGSRKGSFVFRLFTWILAGLCFYLVYGKIQVAAVQEGKNVWQYLLDFFSDADWVIWLCIMIPYSVFFFLVDSHATWRVIRWFNAPSIRFRDILPIRASAYILSLVNEQVGKGAMSLYLLRKHKVPGWEALSGMILLGINEIYQLLLFSSVGVLIGYEIVKEASTLLPLDIILPSVFLGAAVYLPIHIAFFRGRIFPNNGLPMKSIFHALRLAKPRHYAWVIAFKAPNLIGAVVVYTIALGLFQVDVSLGQMLAFLPVIFLAAALPLPFHAGALLLWTVLFPDYPEVGAFSLVMHTFFVIFNALIGVLFLPKANKELFGSETS